MVGAVYGAGWLNNSFIHMLTWFYCAGWQCIALFKGVG